MEKLIGLKRIVNVLVTHIEVIEWIFLVVVVPASQPFRLFSWRIGGRKRCVLFKLANDPPSIEGFGVVHEFSFFLFFTFHIVPWPSFLPSLSACSRWCLKGKKKMEGGGGFLIIVSSVSFKSSVKRQLLLFFLSFDHQHEEWWMLIMSTFHLFFFFFLHTHSWKQKVD